MTAFAILRIKKHKNIGSLVGVARHHCREIACPTADPSKSSLNRSWRSASEGSKAVGAQMRQVIKEAQSKADRKFRTDSVKGVEYMLTASNEWWQTADKKARTGFLTSARQWVEDRHDDATVVASWLHLDERSPHLHIFVVPLKDGVLNAKHFFGGAKKMEAMQDDFWKVCGEPYGLSRGLKKSAEVHTPVADWWAALNAPTAQPSKFDHAKASIGIEVPSIDVAAKQSRAYEVSKKAISKARTKAALVSKRESELDAKAVHLAERERMADGRIERLTTLEKENIALRAQLAKLAPVPVAPGQELDLAGLGL